MNGCKRGFFQTGKTGFVADGKEKTGAVGGGAGNRRRGKALLFEEIQGFDGRLLFVGNEVKYGILCPIFWKKM